MFRNMTFLSSGLEHLACQILALQPLQWQLEMESSGTPDDFLAGFDALAQAVRRARGGNGGAPNGGLSLFKNGLLEVVADKQTARVPELAALERREIVQRPRSDEDRRAVAVTLTYRGRELLSAEQEWLRGRQRAFYASLPSSEQQLAPDLLFRLAALIDDLAAGPEA